MLLVVLALAQLVKLQEAQSRAANLPPAEARFAGLAFAERADWTPDTTAGRVSLESLQPFGKGPRIFVAAETAPEPEPVADLTISLDAAPSSDSEPERAALELPNEMELTQNVAPPGDAAQVALADADDPVPSVAKPAVEMVETAPADDPLGTIVLPIDPAPVDLTPSPLPVESTVALSESPAMQSAVPPLPELTATAALMPESEPIPVAPSIVEPDATKLEPAASASLVPDVKLPLPRPRNLKLATAHAPVATRSAQRAKVAHPKAVPRRPKASNSGKPVRVVVRRPVTSPVAAQPVRPQPTDPFTALFGSPRAVTGARN
jgi:hypothetical protein